MPRNTTLAILALVIAVISGHSLGIAGDGYPTLRSPYPILLAIPLFLGVPAMLVAIAFGTAFMFWSRYLERSDTSIPHRSIILLVVTTIVSTLIYASVWEDAIQYPDETFVVEALVSSVVMAVALYLLAAWNHRMPSFAASATFHFFLFAWLGTYAVPWVGEVP
jgi:hypothetical protein